MGAYLNPGNELFEISVNDNIYIDKSEFIIFTNKFLGKRDRYICVSRPRRFGEFMAAEMLAAYYDKSCDSLPLFQKLKISKTLYLKKFSSSKIIFRLFKNFI